MKHKKEPVEWTPPRIGYEQAVLASDRNRAICQMTGEHLTKLGSRFCLRCGWIETSTAEA